MVFNESELEPKSNSLFVRTNLLNKNESVACGYFSTTIFSVCFPLPAVNRIKEQYKVSVRIPQDSERSNLVRIEGDPKGVQMARKELIEMVQRMVRATQSRLAGSFRRLNVS